MTTVYKGGDVVHIRWRGGNSGTYILADDTNYVLDMMGNVNYNSRIDEDTKSVELIEDETLLLEFWNWKDPCKLNENNPYKEVVND